MPTAPGYIKTLGDGRLNCVFILPDTDKMYTFIGTFTPHLPAFMCSDVSLVYDSIDQLTGTRAFEGMVGPIDATIVINNGVTISGQIDGPGSPGLEERILGSAAWPAEDEDVGSEDEGNARSDDGENDLPSPLKGGLLL
ncbi:hypothetical protein B0H34DRAFT_685998 [Crassisporium funariophilum]|nr:hypothetical protein B0H34DRAFT_685998 [Crassisporium funariophilum]